jgi:hypothetical protein
MPRSRYSFSKTIVPLQKDTRKYLAQAYFVQAGCLYWQADACLWVEQEPFSLLSEERFLFHL